MSNKNIINQSKNVVKGINEIITNFHNIDFTLNPEITLFKNTTKQYHNFALNINEIFFDGNIGFGKNVSAIIPKNGDLISKIYLKVILPKISNDNNINIVPLITSTLQDLKNEYSQCKTFFKLVNDAINNILNTLLINNYDYSLLKSKVMGILTAGNLSFYNNILLTDLYNNFLFAVDIFSDFNNDNIINENTQFVQLYPILTEYVKYKLFQLKNLNSQKQSDIFNLSSFSNGYIYPRFKWVKNIGNNIINRANLLIGSQLIDMLDSDILNIKHEMYDSKYTDLKYNNMIGNVSNIENNEYTLLIPLKFNFTDNYSCSLPVFILINNEIKIDINFNKIQNCAIYDNTFNINNIKILNASLIVEYIHLDNTEQRQKYLKESSEYLIQQFQSNSIRINPGIEFNIEYQFFNPTKILIWFNKPFNIDNYFINNYGVNLSYQILYINTYDINFIEIQITNTEHKLKKNNYIQIVDSYVYDGLYKIINTTYTSIIINKKINIFTTLTNKYTGKILLLNNNYTDYAHNNELHKEAYNLSNTIVSSSNNIDNIQLHSITDSNYTSLIQNYQYNKRDIDSGINQINFGLNLYKYNSTGFINLSVVTRQVQLCKYNDIYINNMLDYHNDNIFKIYALSYNIMIFKKGNAKLKFSY